jgi:adenylate cyclase class 2
VKTPVENEIKLSVETAAKARALLRRNAFTITTPRVFERNLVLDDEKGSLRKCGMLLRVRGAFEPARSKPARLKATTCTFKGPATPGRHKRREEREFRASDLESPVAVFAALGFREAFRYEKYRTEVARGGEAGHVTLDETPIGVFLELEGPARWIDRTAAHLGFPRSAYVTDSYGKLYEAWCKTRAIEPADMTFTRRQ